MPSLANGTCADCGNPMHLTTRPQGQARCQPCRKTRPTIHRLNCKICGTEFIGASNKRKYCGMACTGRANAERMQIRPPDDTGVKRIHRDRLAPGLNPGQRYKLRDQLIRRGTRCAYCNNPATTIDHVVPLVRGGTSYEGNLVVCCKSCNSSKAGSTIMEWRTGRRLPRMVTAVTWPARPKRQPKPIKVRPVHDCPMCGTPTSRRTYCTPECATERERRYMRDKYRATACLPIDPNKPTKPFVSAIVLKTG